MTLAPPAGLDKAEVVERSPPLKSIPRTEPSQWTTLGVLGVLVVLVNVGALASEAPLLRLARYQFAPTAASIIVYEDAPRADVMFMGSSRALFGLDPAVASDEVTASTGAQVRALNIAIAGGATDMNYLILKNVIDRAKQPRIVVYGLAEFELMQVPNYDPCRFPYFALLLRWDDSAVCTQTGLNDRLDFIAEQLAPMYRDRELIRSGLSLLLNPDDVFSNLYHSGTGRVALRDDGFGTWPPNLPVDERTRAATRAGILAYLSKFQLDPARVARLDDFLTLAKQRGIEVILVSMPVPPEFLQLWDDGASIDRFDAQVHGIAQAHAVALVDLYANLADGTLPADAFIDLHHLTPDGAAIVTRLIADEYLAPRLKFAANS